MIQIPMSPLEFEDIEGQLQKLNPDEGVELHEITPGNGDITGKNPINWTAEYTFDGKELTVHGHGFFGFKIEHGIQQKLDAALVEIRK